MCIYIVNVENWCSGSAASDLYKTCTQIVYMLCTSYKGAMLKSGLQRWTILNLGFDLLDLKWNLRFGIVIIHRNATSIKPQWGLSNIRHLLACFTCDINNISIDLINIYLKEIIHHHCQSTSWNKIIQELSFFIYVYSISNWL